MLRLSNLGIDQEEVREGVSDEGEICTRLVTRVFDPTILL